MDTNVITRPAASSRSELECGHYQPVKPGNGTAWCPPCGELRLVREQHHQQ